MALDKRELREVYKLVPRNCHRDVWFREKEQLVACEGTCHILDVQYDWVHKEDSTYCDGRGYVEISSAVTP